MSAARTSPNEPSKPSAPPAFEVAPELISSARKRAGLPVITAGEPPRPLCPAARSLSVLHRDGSLLPCDYATPHHNTSTQIREGTEAQTPITNAELRDHLANNRLPTPHCRWCIAWTSHGILSLAPPIRDYGLIACTDDTDQPSHIAVPASADGLSAAQIDWLHSATPNIQLLTVEIYDITTGNGPATLTAIRELEPQPLLAVRLRHLSDVAESLKAFGDLTVTSIELTLTAPDTDQLDRLRQLTDQSGAIAITRFVLTPECWFELEDTALQCAAANLPLDVRVLDRHGAVPLALLGLADLHFVADVVAHTDNRLAETQTPNSLAKNALADVARELHSVLHELTDLAALTADAENTQHKTTKPPGQLHLPAVDHNWNHDERAPWWWEHLLGHAHLECIQQWVVQIVTETSRTDSQEPPWLRQLIHRIASENRSDTLLQRLRDIYGPTANRHRLKTADSAFLEGFPVTKFGGPWAAELGLHPKRRERLLRIGPPNKPANGSKPDITVLIPSYRHEDYIEETIQSVLAQDYTNYLIVVVDDRSPDETVARAKHISDRRVQISINNTNLGLGNSVLKALESIDTPYVALLNSDDLLHPERLSRCRDVLESNPGVQLVTTGIALIDHQGGELTADTASLVFDGKKVVDWVHWFDRITPPADLPSNQLFGELLERNFLVTSSNIVARTDWLRKQAHSLRSLKFCLDWQLFLEAALEGSLHHIHEPLVAYRLHATNTVWFREGRRWSYFLEVNRVAADALRRFSEQGRLTDERRLHQTLEAVTKRLANNSEVDGFALFAHALIDALSLDEAAATSPTVQALVEHMNDRAHTAEDEECNSSSVNDRRIDRELSRKSHNEARRLRREATSLDMRLMFAEDTQKQLQQEISSLYADQHKRIEEAREQQEQTRKLYEDQRERMEYAAQLEQDKQELYRDQEQRIAHAKIMEERIHGLYENQKQRIAHAQELELKMQSLYEDQRQRITYAQELEAQIEALRKDKQLRLEQQNTREQNFRAEITQLEADNRKSEQDHAVTLEALQQREQEVINSKATIEAKTAQLESLANSKNTLEKKRNELLHEVASLHEEIDRLLKTREFRTGHLIWNKMPLGYMSRRGKKWYRRLLNAKDRAKMMFKRSKETPHGTAIVAACWQWPIYSHTFVYQEMISLSSMGLDVQLLHWDLGSTDQLHAAFQYLYDNRTQLQPVWETHQKDFEHFEKTRPGKLRSFLERISPLCGKSVEQLEKEPIVLQACTFARMAELAKARYIHSYFFYDQSFMAMQAAWLLDLPRGVSCYADHMMDDYPWKFVPLHVELCDVIVATSERIKSELSGMTGGKFDDKIIVKPNGVDGDRFPARERSARKVGETFEVLSVSRIEPKKGLTHLVEAMAQLKELGHTVVAHIIGAKDEHSKGSLEYAAEFEACIAEHGLQEQVILHGMMKQELMPPIIERCRAFVAPYVETESGDKDGIPTAMLEALASCLPVITTDSGSIVEVIDDGVEGLIVDQHDSTAFANALRKIITDPELEQRMAKSARRRFDKDFDIRVTERRLHERVTGFLARKH